jgi:epsilon-lactone hydrolase
VDSATWSKLLDRLAANAPKSGESIATMRANLEASAAKIRVPDGVAIEPISTKGVAGEWIRPDRAIPGRVILYLHGGGYALGSLASHRALAARIALKTAAEVFVLDYRLAPEHPFPAAVDDGLLAAKWLRSVRPAADVVIAGDSAGAGLAIAVMVAMRAADMALPHASVLLSPWCDLSLSGESIDLNESSDPQPSRWFLTQLAKAYLGSGDAKAPLASPLYADLNGLPPMLIQVGDAEMLLDDGRRLAEAALSAGVDVRLESWANMIHVWHALAPLVPDADHALDGVATWLQGFWSASS